jgi:hypothetical protein
MLYCELVTEPVEGVEITWEMPYLVYPCHPGTCISPPEGGPEIEGDARPVSVTYWPEQADEYTIPYIPEGCMLELLLLERYGLPADKDCIDAIIDDANAREL